MLLRGAFRQALFLALIAGLSDWCDGFVARRLGVTGRTGAVLDPAADKTLLVTLFLVLGIAGRVPVWMVVLTIARDVLIVTGAFLLWAFHGIRQFSPAPLGKISTFFQILFILLVLICAAYPNGVDTLLAQIVLLLSAVFTVLSGADYVRRGLLLAKSCRAS
jgi:cardiolipin synthase